MYKNVLEDIEGISIYPVFSFVVFFVFFTLMFIWVIKSDGKMMEMLGNLPLENEGANNQARENK